MTTTFLDRLVDAAIDVCCSADDTGCDGVFVVDRKALLKLAEILEINVEN